MHLHSGFESYLGALIMMERKPNIAILYFSLSAEAEHTINPGFLKTDQNNRHLASTLISDTYLSLKNQVLIFSIFTKETERIPLVVLMLLMIFLKKGFDAVIAVGNDAPELAKTDWNQVVEELEAGNSVLGPTYRQGAYLIGLTKDHFQKTYFSNFPGRPALYGMLFWLFLKKWGKVLLLQRQMSIRFLMFIKSPRALF
ncbi:MAG: DUF2064 domain-containing protein [Saprospiraceae bacterium]